MTPEEEETLEQFQRITGTSLTRAQQIALLDRSSWHLELALLDYNARYPEEAASRLNEELRSTELRRGSSSRNRVMMPGTFPGSGGIASDNPEVAGLTGAAASAVSGEPSKWQLLVGKVGKFILDAVAYVLVVPFYVVYRVFGAALVVLVGVIAPVLRGIAGKRGYRVVRKRNDPADVARRFAMEFDELVKPSSRGAAGIVGTPADEESLVNGLDRPDFLQCAYSQALYVVKKEARWLVVYIQSGIHDETAQFAKDVLINPRFLDFVNENNFLVWGGDVKEPESFQVANQFKVNKLPFLGLMCLTVNQTPTASGVQESAPVLSLVCKIQGYNNCNEVIARMTRAYTKYEPTVSQLRADYERQNQARAMRQLQDQAYQKSLERDRKKKEAKQRAANKKKNEKLWRAWRREHLCPEAAGAAPGEFARVAIRLPNGQRIQYRFNKTCKLEELYAYIECVCLHGNEEAPATVQKPADFEYKFPFKVMSVMPRQEVPADDQVSFAECNAVYPSGNLVVEMSTTTDEMDSN